MATVNRNDMEYKSEALADLHEKLLRQNEISPQMRALAEAAWNLPRTTDPQIAELQVSHPVLLMRLQDDIGFNQTISAYDAKRNFNGLMDAMNLDEQQTRIAMEGLVGIGLAGEHEIAMRVDQAHKRIEREAGLGATALGYN